MTRESESRAPWTLEQVRNLNAFQASGRFHPFTCPNRNDGKHRTTVDLGALVATTAGWSCPDCHYHQDWAHEFMVRPLPPPMRF